MEDKMLGDLALTLAFSMVPIMFLWCVAAAILSLLDKFEDKKRRTKDLNSAEIVRAFAKKQRKS